MVAIRKTLSVLPRNALVAEEDSCSLGPDGATDLGISSERSSPVEFTNSEVEDDSESLSENEKEAGNERSKSSGKKGRKDASSETQGQLVGSIKCPW